MAAPAVCSRSRRRDWSDRLIERAGLDRGMFPRVVEPGTIIGKITASAAAETGLAAGTPVVAGGGDAQLGTIGLGVVRPGDAAVLGGTFWQQIINIPSGQVDPTDARPHQSVGDPRHQPGGVHQLLRRPVGALVPRCLLRRGEAPGRSQRSRCL